MKICPELGRCEELTIGRDRLEFENAITAIRCQTMYTNYWQEQQGMRGWRQQHEFDAVWIRAQRHQQGYNIFKNVFLHSTHSTCIHRKMISQHAHEGAIPINKRLQRSLEADESPIHTLRRLFFNIFISLRPEVHHQNFEPIVLAIVYGLLHVDAGDIVWISVPSRKKDAGNGTCDCRRLTDDSPGLTAFSRFLSSFTLVILGFLGFPWLRGSRIRRTRFCSCANWLQGLRAGRFSHVRCLIWQRVHGI